MLNRVEYLRNSRNTFHKKSYKYPSLKERIELLRSYRADGLLVAVHIYEKEDHGIFRYRVYNPYLLANLPHGDYRTVFFFKSEINDLMKVIHLTSIVVLVRAQMDRQIGSIIDKVKENQIPLVYDIDDYIFDISKLESLYKNQLGQENRGLDAERRRFVSVDEVISNSDRITTTTNFLAKKLSDKYGDIVDLIPNTYNHKQLTASGEGSMLRKHFSDDAFIFGYFSGSYTHNKDLALILEAVERFLAKHKDAYFILGGAFKVVEELERLGDQVICLPLQNSIELQRIFGVIDLNLIPLVDTEFNNCKSQLKFFEAAISNIPCIASDIETYREIATDNSRAIMLAKNNSEDWYNSFEKIYKDRSLRKNLSEEALSYTQGHFSPKVLSESLTEHIENVYIN